MRAASVIPVARIGWCWSFIDRRLFSELKLVPLKDALLRIASAADIVGARAVLVQAIDEPVKEFYLHFDFEHSPVHELKLMLLMKDLRKALGE